MASDVLSDLHRPQYRASPILAILIRAQLGWFQHLTKAIVVQQSLLLQSTIIHFDVK